jgi:putative glutamine amidotransferase
MSNHRPFPVIGMTALRSPDRDSFHHILTGPYLRAVTAAGGFPVVLPAIPERAGEALDLVSGLLLIGGGDIEAKQIGKTNHPQAKFFNPLRDEFELAAIREAVKRKMPLFGICRGEQMINIALGGTIYQDIADEQGSGFEHNQEDKPNEAVHAASIAPDSCLAAILGTTQVSVNSVHHQAVRDPAPGLTAVAWAQDGVVEAVESCGGSHGFILGVQWHPERLVEHQPEQRRLFERFVKAAECFLP